MGNRSSSRMAPRIGAAFGVGTDPIGTGIIVLNGVTRDAASGIYCPANAGEWTIAYNAAGINPALAPSSCWLMQEASGDLIDPLAALTLTASGLGLAYQQTVAGWTRKAVTTADGSTGVFTSTDASLIDILVGSSALLVFAKPTTSGTTRSIHGMGLSVTRCAAECVATTGVPSIVCGANSANGASDPTVRARPWLVQINRTASSATLYTDQEIVAPAFGATASGKQLTIGALALLGSTCSYLYGAYFKGNSAELSVPQWRVLLRTLGWTIPW